MSRRISTLIENSLLDFRIAGGKPLFIGICPVVLRAFSDEMKAMQRESDRTDAIITQFLGLPVTPMGGNLLNKDGFYIHGTPLPIPFQGVEEFND